MITLFGIDADGNSVYTYNGEDSNLLVHTKIAQEILDRRHDIQHVAIVNQTAHMVPSGVTWGVQLLNLLSRSQPTEDSDA